MKPNIKINIIICSPLICGHIPLTMQNLVRGTVFFNLKPDSLIIALVYFCYFWVAKSL